MSRNPIQTRGSSGYKKFQIIFIKRTNYIVLVKNMNGTDIFLNIFKGHMQSEKLTSIELALS